MRETPLRRYLTTNSLTAEGFAAQFDLSVWNVRHWARGNKVPSLRSQLRLAEVTEQGVTPADWLDWILRSKAAA